MGPSVTVDEIRIDDDVVIALSGELDILSASICVRDLVRTAAGVAAPRRVVIDLRGLDHFGAAGLSAVITFAGHCAQRGLRPSVVTRPDTIQARVVHLFEDDITRACTSPAPTSPSA
jgi:anti-anti-sigma factor